MTFKKLLLLAFLLCSVTFIAINKKFIFSDPSGHETIDAEPDTDDPEQFLLFHKGIRTREGEDKPSYRPAYLVKELYKAKTEALARKSSSARQQSNGVLEWTERGPANVPGRTRGVIIDPDDPAKNTWYAGSVGGGVWRTTNGGQTWTHLTPELPNLATTVLAMAQSNHNIIYLGTGEGFGNVDGVNGNGMFKSIDRGQTWNYLPSTADFNDINRAIVHPSNPDIVVVASNNGIYRTIDGGTNWNHVSDRQFIQDLRATPGNFNVQYAAQNGIGVIKSIDGGITWILSNAGMSPAGRVEIAISPVTPTRLFASAEGSVSGSDSDLYVSDNAGVTWAVANVSFNNSAVNFLGGQGWYDNTLACDPFDDDIVYFGGVGIFRVTLTLGSTSVNTYTAEEVGTSFMDLVSFNNGDFHGGTISLGPAANGNVEVRFGPGRSQKAHHFFVPVGATSGVPDGDYQYQDYIDVPFEVWEVDVNGADVRQLMVSFRDQGRDGAFNLILSNTIGTSLEQSREYIFINNVTYNESAPDPSITLNGGHVFNEMYFFWPVLSGGTWNPASLPNSELRIFFTSIPKLNATTTTVADVYNQFDGKNRFQTFGLDMHPDQHNIVMIPMTGSTYKILVANDGGLFISNTSTTPGIVQGDWTMVGRSYNTSQFYGADKRPGKNEYFGGMQDNGTWQSPSGLNSTFATDYLFNIGGDGFEVLWNNLDDQKLIGGSQFNNFRRSTNGGSTWGAATAGLTGDAPFISKLANSKNSPDIIYTATSSGVFRSTNFGLNWDLTPITEKWGASTFLDVEVSRANANIVWAGSGMTSTRSLHVSTDGGLTFNEASNFSLIPNFGTTTKLASHPLEKHTAYALFSFADFPKILRTEDLGQTWEDISGFGLNDESSTGFPDVAVYCLYVRPDDPNIIWAGTEIGIVESLDNGQTWALLDDFPNVSVWDMKGQDNQVVIATHGRGIWTATIDQPQSGYVALPEIQASGTSPKKELMLRISNPQHFDSVQLFIAGSYAGTIQDWDPGTYDVVISSAAPGLTGIKFVGFLENAPFHSNTYTIEHLDIFNVVDSYSTYFSTTSDIKLTGMSLKGYAGSTPTERKVLQTLHPYAVNTTYKVHLLRPIKISNSNPTLFYADIAITEPGQDTVLVEATKNGLDWFPLTQSYDASSNAAWQAAYTNSQPGQKSMLENKEIDLSVASAQLNPGDTVILRFSMYSNATPTGWGWVLDFIAIQVEPTGIENLPGRKGALTIFPNPASETTRVEFTLVKSSEVELEVIDLSGKKMTQLRIGRKEPGEHSHSINVRGYPSGSYVVVLKTKDGNKKGKLIIRN